MMLSPELCQFLAGRTLADDVQEQLEQAHVDFTYLADKFDKFRRNKGRYIVASANKKAKEPTVDISKVNSWYYGFDDVCEYIFGPCHPDILHVLGRGWVSKNPDDMGFIDNYGKWWSRKDALTIAVSAGQIKVRNGKPVLIGGPLTSEDLWSESLIWPRAYMHPERNQKI